jgi:putative NADPH-quinone reductase
MEIRKIFVLVGHPDSESLTSELATHYVYGAEEAGHTVRRTNLGEIAFDPILHRGYKEIQALEPDLIRVQEDIRWADHVVILYPAWWSTMPALLKGMFDRMWLPRFAYQFYTTGPFAGLLWRPLMKGKTARVFVLSDSPPILARLIFGDTTNEIRKGILWFSGFRARVKKIGPLKFATEHGREKWKLRFHRWGGKAY